MTTMSSINHKYSLREYVESLKKRLIEGIDMIDVSESMDVSPVADELMSKYTIVPLELKDPEPSEPIETNIELESHFGGTYKQKVFKIGVRIPFEGDQHLFDCYPSQSMIVSINQPLFFENNVANVTFVFDELDPNKFKEELDKLLVKLGLNIPRINSEIAPWNSGLSGFIEQLFQQRRGISAKKTDFMNQIGLRINPQSTRHIVPPPVLKRAIPKPSAELSGKITKPSPPTLGNEVFKDIKDTLQSVGSAVERKPSLYKGRREEDLRDIFLLFLETRYESTTGVGEAFNKGGKTDILLKYSGDGSNVFVAECKFWKGKKALFEAVDQLLSYLTHRDSKTSLMLFVREKDFSSILDVVRNEIPNHKQFKRPIGNTIQSSISCVFTLPDGPDLEIAMEIMPFDFKPLAQICPSL